MSDYADGSAYFPTEFKVSLLQEKVKALECQVAELQRFIKEVKNYVDAEDFLDYDIFMDLFNDFGVEL